MWCTYHSHLAAFSEIFVQNNLQFSNWNAPPHLSLYFLKLFFYSGCLLDINFKGNLKYDNRYLPTDTTLVLHSFYLGCGKMGHFKLPCGIFPYIYGRGILTWINISTLNTLMEFYMIFTEYYYYFDGMLYIFHFSFFRIIRYSTI